MGISGQNKYRETDPLTELLSQNVRDINSFIKNLSIVLSKIKMNDEIIKQKNKERNNYISEVFLNEEIVNLYLHPNFTMKMEEFFNFFIQELKILLKKKVKLFVSKEKWKLYFYLSELLVIGFDDKILKYVNEFRMGINVISSPDEIVEEISSNQSSFKKKSIDIQIIGVNDSNRPKKLEEINNIFIQFLYYCVQMKNHVISRSSLFPLINGIIGNILALIPKTFYSSSRFLLKKLTVFSYSLCLGVEKDIPSIINLSAKLIEILITKNTRSLKFSRCLPIPSYFSEYLPLLSCENAFESISTLCLYALCYKNKEIDFDMISNLFMTIVKAFKPKNREILYFLDILSEITESEKKEKVIEIYKVYEDLQLPVSKKIQELLENLPEESEEEEKESEPLILQNLQTHSYFQSLSHNYLVKNILGEKNHSVSFKNHRRATLSVHEKIILEPSETDSELNSQYEQTLHQMTNKINANVSKEEQSK